MKNRVLKLAVLFIMIGMFGYFAYSIGNKGERTDVGDKAYNFSLPNLDGKTTKLASYEGQITILNYFATWCAPCKDEAPELEAFAKDYGDQYHLLMINRGETKDRVKKFLKTYKTPATYVFDADSKVSKIYNVSGQPETFVIDKKGVIREHYIGPITEAQLYNFVKKYDE